MKDLAGVRLFGYTGLAVGNARSTKIFPESPEIRERNFTEELQGLVEF
jgi:hypothetical protein